MTLSLVLRTFGTTSITAGPHVFVPGAGRNFAILLVLALRREEKTVRKWLQALLFPGVEEQNARHSLRQQIYELRKKGIRIESEGELLWIPVEDVEADYTELLHPGPKRDAHIDGLARGLLAIEGSAYGELLDRWLDEQRELIASQLRRALVGELALAQQKFEWGRIECLARAILATDSLNEEATLALAECLALHGSKKEAIALLEQYSVEVGPDAVAIRVPARILRRRISENLATDSTKVRMLGRDVELARLLATMRASLKGEAAASLLWGEPGIGKSRLAEQLCTHATIDGASVHRVSGRANDEHRSLSGIARLVPGLLGAPGALGISPASLADLSRLQSGAGGERSVQEEHQEIFSRIVDAFIDLAEAITAETPLMIVVDDCHLVDAASLRILASLVRQHSNHHFFLLLCSRGRLTDSLQRHFFGRLLTQQLKGIAPAAGMTLLAEGASLDPETESTFLAWAVDLASGNPLFLERIADHVKRTGERFSIPPSISELIRDRYRSLPERSRRLLQIIFILGPFARTTLAQSLLAAPAPEFLEHLQALEEAGLIRTDDSILSLSHALVGDEVLSSSARSVVMSLHAQAARLLTADLRRGRVTSDIHWAIADHWEAAGEKARAAKMLTQCAPRLATVGQPHLAAATLDRALNLFPFPDRQVVAICESMLAYAAEGDAYSLTRSGIVRYRAARERMGIPLDPYDPLLLRLLECEWLIGIASHDRLEALRDWAAPARPADLRIRATRQIIHLAEDASDPAIAHVAFNNIADIPTTDPEYRSLYLPYHALFGDMTSALDECRQILHDCRDWQLQPRGLHRMAVSCLFVMGLFEEMLAPLELLLLNSSRRRSTTAVFSILAHLANASIATGMVEEARRWHAEAKEVFAAEPKPAGQLTHLGTAIELAYLDQDPTALSEALRQSAREYGGTLTSARPAWVQSCYYLELHRLQGNWDLLSTAVEEAREQYRRLPALLYADTQVALISRALNALSRPHEARDLFSDYTAHRRRALGPLIWELEAVGRDLTTASGKAD